MVAVCDVYQPHLEGALEMAGGKARPYKDYRRLLEDRDVQAVVIATPDHWHPLICIDACNAGKDVYVEKPVSNRLREGRLMVETARGTNRVVQVGLQQRSGTHFQRAVKAVQDGRLGRIHYVHCWNHEFSPPEGFGNPPDTNPPPDLNWDFWLGPAPKVPYNENRFRAGRWRWFFDYGGGKLTDWGSHLIDVVHWAMKVNGPLSATASGGKYYVTDNRETPETLQVVYEYPGFLLCYSTLLHSSYGHNGHSGSKPFGSYGILFQGSLGTLFVDRAGYEIFPQTSVNREPTGAQISATEDPNGLGLYYTSQLTSERGTSSFQHDPHVRNFLDCLKNRKRPNADIEIGHEVSAAGHLGNIAFRLGQKIMWDAKAEKITNSAESNAMLTRHYRAPWRLPGLEG